SADYLPRPTPRPLVHYCDLCECRPLSNRFDSPHPRCPEQSRSRREPRSALRPTLLPNPGLLYRLRIPPKGKYCTREKQVLEPDVTTALEWARPRFAGSK